MIRLSHLEEGGLLPAPTPCKEFFKCICCRKLGKAVAVGNSKQQVFTKELSSWKFVYLKLPGRASSSPRAAQESSLKSGKGTLLPPWVYELLLVLFKHQLL